MLGSLSIGWGGGHQVDGIIDARPAGASARGLVFPDGAVKIANLAGLDGE